MSMISELVDRLRAESKSMGKYGVDYMATLLARSADTIEMLSEKARADTSQSCFNCDHYEPKGWCNLFEDTVSPNYKCCSEFAEIKPYEYEIKALHKDHQEPYCKVADTPQTDCETCKHYKLACELFSEVCKYEPITQTETQNSNLTFEKVMEEIQTQVIEFPDTHQKFTFARKIEMDGDSIKIGGWEYKGVKDAEREDECIECHFEPKADTPQTDCGWGKPTTVSHSKDKED